MNSGGRLFAWEEDGVVALPARRDTVQCGYQVERAVSAVFHKLPFRFGTKVKFEGVPISGLRSGDTINGIYVLKSCELRVGSNKKPFLDLVFLDATGEVSGKDWNVAPDFDPVSLPVHKLYYVNARVDTWKDATQLSVNRMKLADEGDQAKIGEFVPSAPLAPEAMLAELYAFAARIRNTHVRSIVLVMLDEREAKLLYYPAAKSLHHAIRSGLLFHLVRMLRAADAIAGVYPSVDTDLLFAGVLLHDLAKMDEMDASELGIAEYSKVGKLLGHIVIGVTEIDRVGRELNTPEEVVLILKHLVLSHHEKAEYGSPKPPMFLEAELLHHIDTMDARIYDYEKALQDVKPGAFSEPVWSLDRRNLYRTAYREQAVADAEQIFESEQTAGMEQTLGRE